jgi:hypothetical protein
MCLARCGRPPSQRSGLTTDELSNSRIAFLAYTRAAHHNRSSNRCQPTSLCQCASKHVAAALAAAANLRLTFSIDFQSGHII